MHDRLVSCLFCQIVTGELTSVGIYEDSHTVGILDLRQPGWPDVAHLLILPRQHVEMIDELSHRSAITLMASVVKAAKALRSVCDPPGISVWQSNGKAAGQEVPHVHFHLLTRTPGDGLLRVYPTTPEYPSQTDLEPLAQSLRAILGS
jgi:histidine triad (HIT) family protein